ncbi:hypothetical protein GCM10025783_14710 [Amnibacterium soli]|uniref:Uncharacterized protein n=1 Tax=Amnibacterium soli TaxID=1282736 RepID=A0ABP8Z1U9_9MICO
MADDRSITGSAATGDDVHDDDELAEVLAAELERYATGAVPVLPRATGEAPVPPAASAAAPAPIQPLAVPRATDEPAPAVRAPEAPAAAPDAGAFARRAAEVEREMRRPATAPVPTGEASESFRRADRPAGRRSATGPVLQPTPLLTAEDLPVKRRTGFRPPPSAVAPPERVEPLDRVLPTGPISLPEPTASLLESMISDATGPVAVQPPQPEEQHVARHAAAAAAPLAPEPQTGPVPGLARHTGPTGLPDPLYEDWEQSLRAIGRPRDAWQPDDELVPTGGDPDMATVAIPVQSLGRGLRAPQPVDEQPPVEPAPPVEPLPALHGAHAVPPTAPVERSVEEPPLRRPRSGRRRADVPEDTGPVRDAPSADPAGRMFPSEPVDLAPEREAPTEEPVPAVDPASAADPNFARWLSEPLTQEQQAQRVEPAPFSTIEAPSRPAEADDEGIDETPVEYREVSAATTGAVDLPQIEPRPRTAPVLIERVRTAILQLPTVPPSPTGSGAAAIVGRWFGAFASPLTLVLAFGLAAAGAGSAAVAAVLLGALLAVPAVLRTAVWSAGATDDGAMQEASVLGRPIGRIAAIGLLVARVGAAAAVVLLAGSVAGAWADRTGALGLTGSSAALLGSTVVALLAILCAALPTRATAVLTLLAAVVGAVGTLLVALVLAPTGGTAVTPTAAGGVAAAVGGFVAVGLLLVLCGADVARWRTDHANPTSTAVGAVVAAVLGAVVLVAGTLIASRLAGGGDAVDEFAGALSDASASLLAAPMLVILLLSAVTLPALLLRSSGAAAARLLGAGRPVRLGAVAAGLLALAAALGVLAAGADPVAVAVAAAALLGVPVAAWAGLLAVTSGVVRPLSAAVGLVLAVVLGWLLSDGLVPGVASPVLGAVLPASSALRGGPAVGLLVALLVGAGAGALGGRRTTVVRPAAGRADTVEG